MPLQTPAPSRFYSGEWYIALVKRDLFARATLLILIGISMGFFGCTSSGKPGLTVRIPEKDSSPPQSTLQVQGQDFSLVITSGSEPEALSLGIADSLQLIAIGVDTNGGIKNLSLIGSVFATCQDSATGKKTFRQSGFLRRNYGGANSIIKGPTQKSSHFTLRAHDLARVCKGLQVSEVVGQATVSAINYKGNRATSSRLEFRMLPVTRLIPSKVSGTSVTQIAGGKEISETGYSNQVSAVDTDESVDGEVSKDHLGGSELVPTSPQAERPQADPTKTPDLIEKAKS